VVLDGAGDGFFIGLLDVGVAEGGDDTLAGLALGVAVGLDELGQRGGLEGFGAEEHPRRMGAGWQKSNGDKYESGTTRRAAENPSVDNQRLTKLQVLENSKKT